MLEQWRSTDVQRDPAAFLKAQQAERERLCIFAPQSSWIALEMPLQDACKAFSKRLRA